MKNKTFKYKFDLWVYIVLSIIAAIVIPTIFLNFCNIFGWFNRFSTALFLDIFVIILGFSVIGIYIYTMFFSNYTITKDTLKISISFYHVKILTENIKQIVYYKETNFLVIFYLNKADSMVFTKIAIKPSLYEEFINALLIANPSINLENDNVNIDNLK